MCATSFIYIHTCLLHASFGLKLTREMFLYLFVILLYLISISCYMLLYMFEFLFNILMAHVVNVFLQGFRLRTVVDLQTGFNPSVVNRVTS